MFTSRYELNLEIQFRLILVLKIRVRHVRWLRRRLLKFDGTLRSCPCVHHDGCGGVVVFLHSFLILALNGNEWTYSCLFIALSPQGKLSEHPLNKRPDLRAPWRAGKSAAPVGKPLTLRE